MISAVIREFAILYAAFHETFGELRMSPSSVKMFYIQTPQYKFGMKILDDLTTLFCEQACLATIEHVE